MPDFASVALLPDVRVRLMMKVHFDEDSQCWIFTGDPTRDRPRITIKGITGEAYKFFFAMANKRNPTGPLLHTCDTPRCVNPMHVNEGDSSKNMQEMVERGRSRNQFTDIKECKRGHKWENEDDFYIRPSGQRECRICKRGRRSQGKDAGLQGPDDGHQGGAPGG
jgi:hypothetical protein